MRQVPEGPATYGALTLQPRTRYRVILDFRDYDSRLHAVGEEWVFRGDAFLPYDDGVTLFVFRSDGAEDEIRLQWRPESQAHVLEALERYVAPV